MQQPPDPIAFQPGRRVLVVNRRYPQRWRLVVTAVNLCEPAG